MKKILILGFLVFFSNLISAQTKEEKKQLKEEKAAIEYTAIKELVNTNSYVFNGTWLTTRNALRIDLTTSSNQLEVKKDSAIASLQFFGEVRSIGFKDEGGIVFDNIMNDYKVIFNEKKRRIQISFNIKDKVESYEVSMVVYKTGFTFVDIFSSHRSTIKYEGSISSVKKK